MILTNGLPDVASSSIFGSNFYGFEPKYIISIEKHITHNSATLVYAVRVATEDDPLGNDTVGVHFVEGASSY